jgi:periplasmic protein TonB
MFARVRAMVERLSGMFRVIGNDPRRRFGVVLLLSISVHILLLVHVNARSPDRLPIAPSLSVSLIFVEPAAPTKHLSKRSPTRTSAHIAAAATAASPGRAADTTSVAPNETPSANRDTIATHSNDSAPPTVQALEQVRALVRLDLQRYFDHSYPPIAQRRGWEGTVSLGVTIRSDGTLDDVRVLRSSGYDMLDRSAVTTMKRIERLAEAGPLLNGRPIELSLPIVYRLTN